MSFRSFAHKLYSTWQSPRSVSDWAPCSWDCDMALKHYHKMSRSEGFPLSWASSLPKSPTTTRISSGLWPKDNTGRPISPCSVVESDSDNIEQAAQHSLPSYVLTVDTNYDPSHEENSFPSELTGDHDTTCLRTEKEREHASHADWVSSFEEFEQKVLVNFIFYYKQILKCNPHRCGHSYNQATERNMILILVLTLILFYLGKLNIDILLYVYHFN